MERTEEQHCRLLLLDFCKYKSFSGIYVGISMGYNGYLSIDENDFESAWKLVC